MATHPALLISAIGLSGECFRKKKRDRGKREIYCPRGGIAVLLTVEMAFGKLEP
jgi:hypothetical protein